MTAESLNKKILLGLGFDCKDGLLRVTKGKDFRLYGGSEDTHSLMQEKAIKFNEQLKQRDKKINDLSRKEFVEIADKIGLNIICPPER